MFKISSRQGKASNPLKVLIKFVWAKSQEFLVHHLGAGFWPLILTQHQQRKHELQYALGLDIYKML